jgi:hypothetical protein
MPDEHCIYSAGGYLTERSAKVGLEGVANLRLRRFPKWANLVGRFKVKRRFLRENYL